MCDDGSTDNTYKIANDYKAMDSRIKVIKNIKNEGLAKTLNHCLKYAAGEYIVRHDGDDLMTDYRIEKQVAFMNETSCDVSGSGAYLFDDDGVWGMRMPRVSPDVNSMVASEPLDHATIILKKEVLSAVNGYTDNELTRQRLEDYELYIKLFENNYTICNMQEPLIYYREDKDSYARRKRRYRLAEAKLRLQACRRLGIPIYKWIFALRPLLIALMPRSIVRWIHLKRASLVLKECADCKTGSQGGHS